MSRFSSSTGRRIVATLTALGTLGTAAGAAAQEPVQPPNGTCAGFVYLEEGKFELDEAPYQLKGVNFGMTIAGKRVAGSAPPVYEYFLAPSNNSRPDNNAICGSPADPSCCNDLASCAQSLQKDIDALHAVDFNSVRLIFHVEWDRSTEPPRPRVGVFRANEGEWPLTHHLYLDNPVQREIVLELIEQQINWLGMEGFRTILLSGNFDHGNADSQPVYLEWLEHLSARLSTNPFLIAYDPQNEPPDQDHDASGVIGNKQRVADLSQGWFDALTLNDPRHLVTVGLLGAGSVFDWDPQIIRDHFTSYHVYSPMPWDGHVHGSHSVANDIYYAALNACGDPCPFGGDFDSANCLMGMGPVMTTGSAAAGEFRYTPMSGANPCPIGQLTANGCVVGDWVPQRDEPFVLPQTLYYVTPDEDGNCPPGAVNDSMNCILHESPPGAVPFLWTDASGQTGFYYEWLSPTDHCHAPAWDDSVNCKLGDVPAGHSPFFLQRPLFYVAATQCGPKKPVHLGETGFTVMPYPGGSKDFWPPPSGTVIPPGLTDMRQRCERASDGPIVDDIQVAGSNYEAEAGTSVGTALLVGCPSCSGQGGVNLPAGGEVRIPLAPVAACANLKIRYRSPRKTYLQMSVNGMPPSWIELPAAAAGGTFETNVDFSFSGADSIALGATEQVHGDFVDQIEFVQGGDAWEGIFPYSHACGFQGMHWWAYASEVYFGDSCRDHGLNAYWYQVESRSSTVMDELLFRPVAETLRDQVDYLAPAAAACEKPAGFNASLHSQVSGAARFTYRGTVKSGNRPLPFAPVWAWFTECTNPESGKLIQTFTDEHGQYVLRSEHPLTRLHTSHYGHDMGSLDQAQLTPHSSSNTMLPTIRLSRLTNLIVDSAALNVPSTPATACWQGQGWVMK